MKHRERTRQLIEPGALVAKSGIEGSTEDDCAVIFGSRLQATTLLLSEPRENSLLLSHRRGKRGFATGQSTQSA
ncbi:conjugal transfer protein TraD [Sphingomonas sp. AR_OL41]|uniref:conjugal transfer protein TraD n=1 Tax=Sphingomonas sp. AR_OL41 TaxID=3042729 RepID=UPI0024816E8C|nr:conjugal transfer protein TraD [Sphingomonas sp. AR_OL41]MDH7973921.1 conjugal transfer protein TraD [Sphingomonas sp. AR_OL41]